MSIGHADLSLSLGVPGDRESALYRAAEDRIVESCRRHNMPFTIGTAPSIEEALQQREQGCFTVFVDDEIGLITRSLSILRRAASARDRGRIVCPTSGSSKSMRTRAAIFLEHGRPFEVAEIDLAGPGPNKVVVRMDAVGICGTDLHQVRGEWVRPTPMVLGHEGSGVIVEVGKLVNRARIGEEVVLTWAASCGACADCTRGRPAACVRLHGARWRRERWSMAPPGCRLTATRFTAGQLRERLPNI